VRQAALASIQTDRDKAIARAEAATNESRYVEFKATFDTDSIGAWCEIIKDIVAFANSGGGVIVFGVSDGGVDADVDVRHIFDCDLADITNRIARYTNYQFSELEIIELSRSGKRYPAFLILGVEIPIVFTKPGTYPIDGGKQRAAFGQGTLYFRHGAKSEPGSRDDLRHWRDREIVRTRKDWLSGITKVVRAPRGHLISVEPPSAATRTQAVVISNNPNDPRVYLGNAQEVFPFRQKELIEAVNAKLVGRGSINSRDATAINRKLDVLKAYPAFALKAHHRSITQYSQAYADWIVEQINSNSTFLIDARAHLRRLEESRAAQSRRKINVAR